MVYLNNYIRDRLAAFTRGRDADDNVFGLAPESISLKIGGWARKAGVSLHPHSLRHKFATDILDRGGNIRAVQQLLGHESLGTTETYLAVTNNDLRDTVNLLDKGRQNKGSGSDNADVGKEVKPVGSAKESKNSLTRHIPESPNVDASESLDP